MRRVAPVAALLVASAGCAQGQARAPARAEARADAAPAERLMDVHTPIADRDARRIDLAIHRYAKDRAGRLPASLAALVTDKSPDGDSYLPAVPADPWGRPYAYAVLSSRLGTYDLRSYGPDLLPGTADDVVAKADPVPIE